LGLVKKVVDEMDELAAGFGNFGDHNFIWRVWLCWEITNELRVRVW
jgi:hypothetical protein